MSGQQNLGDQSTESVTLAHGRAHGQRAQVSQGKQIIITVKKPNRSDFPGGPVVKNPPCNAGDLGAIPGGGTKILYATDLLSPRAATREPICRNERPCMMKLRPNAANKYFKK